MPKSLHFASVPNMRGRLSMTYTDVEVRNLRPAILAKLAKQEMRSGRDPEWCEYEDPTLGWHILEKVSLPGWTKEFDCRAGLVDELRSHICRACRYGLEYEDQESPDVEYDGARFECRDLGTLLGTPCGLEYEVYP